MDLKVIKNFFLYSAGSIILKCITTLISIISITFLTTSEYGLLSLLNTFINIFPIFLNLGLRQAYSLDFLHKNNFAKKQMLNDIITIYLFLAVPILFFVCFNIPKLNKLIFLNKLSFQILLLSLFICFIHFFVELLFQTFRYQSNIIQLTSLQISMAVINLISSFILLYFFKLKILGIVFANLISMFFVFFYGLHLYLKKIGFVKLQINNKKQEIIYYLKLGFPYIPSILFNWLMSFSDRWILSSYTTLHVVGIYSFADSFGQLFHSVFLIPLTGSYIPFLFSKFNENKERINEIHKWNLKNMSYVFLIMLSVVCLGFFSFKYFLYWFLPVKFYESIDLIFFMLLQQIIFMATFFANCYLQYNKKTYIFSGLVIFAAIINLILNLLLIPKFLIYGAIFSTTISYIIYLISILVVTHYVSNNGRVIFENKNY